MSATGPDSAIADEGPIDRLSLYGAPAMAILWIVGTLVAILLFPSFDWTSSAIAEVGRTGQPTAPILDGSLFVGSLFGVLFLWRGWRVKTTLLQRIGLVLLGALILLAGVGQLGVQQPWLQVIVLAFIYVLPIGFAVYGTGEVFAGNAQLGVISFWFALVHMLVWDIITGIIGFSSAIPTFISIVVVSAWILLLYRTLRD